MQNPLVGIEDDMKGSIRDDQGATRAIGCPAAILRRPRSIFGSSQSIDGACRGGVEPLAQVSRGGKVRFEPLMRALRSAASAGST